MFLSIIIPCYNESESINFAYERINNVMKSSIISEEIDYEIIFINDGSKDNTLDNIKKVARLDSKIKYISFSRNFGKESAMLAGLKYAKGEGVVIMDGDLQHPPELLPKMIEFYKEGYDQVIAKRNRVGDNKYKTYISRFYYKIVNSLVEVKLVDGVGDFRLLSRQAVNALISMNEYNRFSKGLFSWIGFKEKIIEYENESRIAGETKWSLKQLLQYGIDGIISFNNKPLRVCFGLGVLLIAISLLYIVITLIQIMVKGIDVPGYFTTITSILIIGGSQLIFTGVLGEYIGRIYYEVKRRPHFIISESNIENNDIYKKNHYFNSIEDNYEYKS